MDINKKKEILKANLAIFEELDDLQVNYVLGYISGLIDSKQIKKLGEKNGSVKKKIT